MPETISAVSACFSKIATRKSTSTPSKQPHRKVSQRILDISHDHPHVYPPPPYIPTPLFSARLQQLLRPTSSLRLACNLHNHWRPRTFH